MDNGVSLSAGGGMLKVPSVKYALSIYDVDKFREFLNDEMMRICVDGAEPHKDRNTFDMEEKEYDNLKSILSKLDKEVK